MSNSFDNSPRKLSWSLWLSSGENKVMAEFSPLRVDETCYLLSPVLPGGSVERASRGEEITGSIPAVAARFLLVGSVSV